MDFDWFLAFYSVIGFLPALLANAAPTIFGGGAPIDFNLNFIDGHRVFGAHKTIKGFISGIIAGTLTGAFLGQYLRGFLLSSGALLGDLVGAFIKRRFDLAPGASFPMLDQLDFVFGALMMEHLIFPVDIEIAYYVFLFTPLAHIVTNVFAYLLGVKSIPW